MCLSPLKQIVHFRVYLCLCFKTSLRVKSFFWKCFWFAWKWTCKWNSFAYSCFRLQTRFDTEASRDSRACQCCKLLQTLRFCLPKIRPLWTGKGIASSCSRYSTKEARTRACPCCSYLPSRRIPGPAWSAKNFPCGSGLVKSRQPFLLADWFVCWRVYCTELARESPSSDN